MVRSHRPGARHAQHEVLAAFVEVYTKDVVPQEELSVTATLLTATGDEVQEEPASLARRAQATGAGERWGATIELPLTGVSPGGYALAVTARSPRGTAQRRVPFVVVE